MAAGLPVICTKVGDAERVVNEGNAGVAIDFEPQALADAVIGLLGHPRRYTVYSASAANYAGAYDWSILFRREFDLIARLDGRPAYCCGQSQPDGKQRQDDPDW